MMPDTPRKGGRIRLNIPPSPRSFISIDIDKKNEIIVAKTIKITPLPIIVMFLAFRTTYGALCSGRSVIRKAGPPKLLSGLKFYI